MGFFKKFVLLTVVVAVGIEYFLYRPIPAGYSKPSVVYLTYGGTALMRNLADIGDFLNLGKDYEIRREMWLMMERLAVRTIGEDDSLEISESTFDGVPVRIYVPKDKLANSPGFVYYHGGGWTVGSVHTYETMVRRLARSLNCVFVSVDYRLAPEHTFPAAFEDCVKATKYFLKNAADFGVDSSRIGLGGDSAGGNLATTVSLKLRDDRFPLRNKLQVLIYPVTQALDLKTPSYQANSKDAMLDLPDMLMYFSSYIPGHRNYSDAFANNEHTSPAIKRKMASSYMDISRLPPNFIQADYVPPKTNHGDEKIFNELKDKLLNPYLSPLVADDLSNLPKAYVLTCDHDVLRDEGVWYALRLKEAGVKVTHVHVDNGFHAMFLEHNGIPEVSANLERLISYLKKNL